MTRSIGILSENGNGQGEILNLLWNEMGLPENAAITELDWRNFMVQYSRRNAEKRANMFIVNATTPAQFFHALRRQVPPPMHTQTNTPSTCRACSVV